MSLLAFDFLLQLSLLPLHLLQLHQLLELLLPDLLHGGRVVLGRDGNRGLPRAALAVDLLPLALNVQLLVEPSLLNPAT